MAAACVFELFFKTKKTIHWFIVVLQNGGPSRYMEKLYLSVYVYQMSNMNEQILAHVRVS